MKLIKAILFFSLTVFLFSIFSRYGEFDSDKWKQKGGDWWMTDEREKMVHDLIQSDTLKGLNKKQVIDLLGQPELENDGELEYLIREKYGIDIDPEYISNLIIEFDENDKVSNCEIEK